MSRGTRATDTRTWIARLASLAIGATAAACSLVLGDLPKGVDPAAGGAGSGGASGSAGAGDTGGTAGTSATGGAGASGGTTPSGGTGGTAACAKPPCDCDGDGAENAEPGCKNDDCADTDPDAHPGQTKFFDHARNDGSGSFDFNCDGKQEQEHPSAVQCLPVTCAVDSEGWDSTIPPCGQAAKWAKCSAPAATCPKVVVNDNFVMWCR